VKISESFEIEVPIARVYDEVNNPEALGGCVAGVKEVVVIGPDESRWKIEARAGFMSRTFKLNGRIVERRPPQYIGFVGNGQDVELTGAVALTELAISRTRVEAVIDASVVGPMASLVDLMAKGPQQALIRETIGNLRKKLESSQEPAARAATSTRPGLPSNPQYSGVLAKVRLLLRRLSNKYGRK
jgi:carbon monoxide dehydrogenase subunit G